MNLFLDLAKTRRSVRKYRDKPVEDAGSSIEHFLLQAADLGLGTCWLGWYSERRIKDILDIPRSKKIVSVISLGYPADEPDGKRRKSIEEISSFNLYRS